MEFVIQWRGQRIGVVKFEVDESTFKPILDKLALFGLNFAPKG